MNTEPLFTLLAKIHPLSESFKAALQTLLIPLSLPKGDMLLKSPNIASHAYFLGSGFAMGYTFIDGKKSIEWFWSAGDIIVSAKSFLEQVPSKESIELVLPSEMLCISYSNLMELFKVFPEANFIHRAIMNQYLEQSRECILDMKNLSALARYNKLIKHYPSIEQMLSQEQIASYLGIAAPSLSRMKRRT